VFSVTDGFQFTPMPLNQGSRTADRRHIVAVTAAGHSDLNDLQPGKDERSNKDNNVVEAVCALLGLSIRATMLRNR
jgi:hypothetical protein